MSLEAMKRICRAMPKVELHAHLNGSISDDMLERIEASKKDGYAIPKFSSSSKIPSDCFDNNSKLDSLDSCFAKFSKIHQVITSPDIVKWITQEIIKEFSQDNTIYIELRTTPKVVHSIPSKDVYIRSVVEGVIESQEELPIIVKLLISVDRKMSVEDGDENVELAIKWAEKFPNIVVGIDFSGDPTMGTFQSFIPSLEKAKKHGLPISCHLPEIPNVDEAKAMLQFLSLPDRVGHACFFHSKNNGNQELWDMLKHSQIPVEVCLTSNVVTKCCPDIDEHHVKYLDQEGMPFVISTDDQGIFDSCLSNEYCKLIQIEGVNFVNNPDKLRQLCLQSVSYIFGSEQDKFNLISTITKFWDAELNLFNDT